MKKLTSSIIGGIAGAVALTVISELIKKIDKATPNADLEKQEAPETAAIELADNNVLFVNAMAVDVICNTFYYSIIGSAKRKQLPLIGLAVGLAAGVSNITVTEPLIVNDVCQPRADKANLLKVACYTVSGLIAGSVMKAFRA